MWYIVENTRFFLINLTATTLVLCGLAFGIPPLINWLTTKMHQEEQQEKLPLKASLPEIPEHDHSVPLSEEA